MVQKCVSTLKEIWHQNLVYGPKRIYDHRAYSTVSAFYGVDKPFVTIQMPILMPMLMRMASVTGTTSKLD